VGVHSGTRALLDINCCGLAISLAYPTGGVFYCLNENYCTCFRDAKSKGGGGCQHPVVYTASGEQATSCLFPCVLNPLTKENLLIERRPSFFAFAGIGTKSKICAASDCRFPPPPPQGELPPTCPPICLGGGGKAFVDTTVLMGGKCFRKR
jgi:hypothetical protein